MQGCDALDALDEMEQYPIMEIGVGLPESLANTELRRHSYDGDQQFAIGAWLSYFAMSRQPRRHYHLLSTPFILFF